jgi:XTP/dITP diphosphohydrolase
MTVTFVTGNTLKYQVAKGIFEKYQIILNQQVLNISELQSTEVAEVASYSAQLAIEQINKPVIVSDVGWYITSLNGFPGTFVKYTNDWLGSEKMLKLMEGELNREVIVKECVGLCIPNQPVKTFISNTKGSIGQEMMGDGTVMDKIFIPDGFEVTLGSLPVEERVKFWQSNLNHYKQAAEYLLSVHK